MSNTTNRHTRARDAASVEHRLARLLDSPFLARVVPHLAPETLHQLIRHRGLEACGELVVSATPAQLTTLLDLDLWRHATPGRDDEFDVDRFGEWLEVLLDTGDAVAARTVAALDPDLVVLGLSRYLRVFDPGTFEPTESTDDEPMDRHDLMNSETSADVPECEVGGYLIRGRRTDAWDAIVALLVVLETEQPDCFQAVMQGCRRLSNSRPEIDGLDDLLLAPQQHGRDVASERAWRQSRRGYATAADARAFLQMARQPRRAPMTSTASPYRSSSGPTEAPATRGATNPIASAYFRALDEEAGLSPGGTSSAAPGRAAPDDATAASAQADGHVARSIHDVLDLLTEAGMMPERPRALLRAAEEDAGSTTRLPFLTRLMESVLHHDEGAYLERTRELAFLANTLLAGCSVQARPFTPQEASDAAAGICNLALECWPSRWSGAAADGAPAPQSPDTAPPPDTFLIDHDLVTTFELGWSLLYEDVSVFVAEQLVSVLGDLRCADEDTRRGLHAFRRTLSKERDAGTPWLAREAADVLAVLDSTAWISVLGLLDECPILPAALRAVLERRTTPVSPTAFEFISTTAQIEHVRLFMSRLRSVLT